MEPDPKERGRVPGEVSVDAIKCRRKKPLISLAKVREDGARQAGEKARANAGEAVARIESARFFCMVFA